MALFSDDEILLIEAKAHQEFDAEQLQAFARDADEVKRLTNVSRVRMSALASSRYDIPHNVLAHFSGPHMTWSELAKLYQDNKRLLRADALFEAAAWTLANNSGGYMSGTDLVAAFDDGERFLVGRRGAYAGHI